MRYYYLAADGTPAGPETLATLTSFVANGALTLATLVAPAGGEDWTPLARVLRFYYVDEGGRTTGPVAFSEIHRLNQIGALPATAWVLEEGATQWKTAASVLEAAGAAVAAPPAPAPSHHPAVYVPPGAGRAHDPYAPPRTHQPGAPVNYRTGGINRLQYFLFSILLQAIAFGGFMAIGLNLFNGGPVSNEELNSLLQKHIAAVAALTGVLFLGSLILMMLRQQNIGWRWYALLLIFVPLVNIWYGIALVAYPPAYARHRQFDTAAKVLIGIMLGVIAGSFVYGLTQGNRLQQEIESRNPPKVSRVFMMPLFSAEVDMAPGCR